MKWLSQMERKFGRYAIPHLMYTLSGIMLAVYLIDLFFSRHADAVPAGFGHGSSRAGTDLAFPDLSLFTAFQFAAVGPFEPLFLLPVGKCVGEGMGHVSLEFILSERNSRERFGRASHRLRREPIFKLIAVFGLCSALSKFYIASVFCRPGQSEISGGDRSALQCRFVFLWGLGI